MTDHDSPLSAMLRRASADAPQGASPELGEKLKDEFEAARQLKQADEDEL